MYQIVKISIVALLVIIAQFVVLPILVAPIWVPELVVLLVVVGLWRWGLVPALWLATIVGVIIDIVGFTLIGVSSIWLVLTVVGAQFARDLRIGISGIAQNFAQIVVIAISVGVGGVINSGTWLGALASIGMTVIISGAFLLINKNNAQN